MTQDAEISSANDAISADKTASTSHIDLLAPWGTAGPPPTERWSPDVLGTGFEARTLELLPDDEGDVVATLVRYLPSQDPHRHKNKKTQPRFVALYVHGRNDYFFQKELAATMSNAGGLFYALDLRKYGRSLRPHQTIGYVDDLATYDEDISEALDVIRSETGDLPLVLMGHSTGGLILTLWVYRHPGVASGLILNSAWLEMQSMAAMRPAIHQVLSRIAQHSPQWEIPASTGFDHYARSLTGGWAASGFDLPDALATIEDTDPAIRGWEYAREWKRPEGYPVPVAWMEAIMEGHSRIEEEVRIDCPVLSMCSTATYFGEEWVPDVFSSDVVLDVNAIVTRSANLGPLVTIARFDGPHDLCLGNAEERQKIWDTITRWLSAFV